MNVLQEVWIMDLSISLPDWLTDDIVKMYRQNLSLAEPYSEEEFDNIPLDGKFDVKRYKAYSAKKTLEKYGLI